MKTKTSLFLLTLLSTHSFASYTILYNLENPHGGALPANSIIMKNQQAPVNDWVSSNLYGSWRNILKTQNGYTETNSTTLQGTCTDTNPSMAATVEEGLYYTATTDCIQNQVRSVQPIETNITTGEVKNVGSVSEEFGEIHFAETLKSIGSKAWVGCRFTDPKYAVNHVWINQNINGAWKFYYTMLSSGSSYNLFLYKSGLNATKILKESDFSAGAVFSTATLYNTLTGFVQFPDPKTGYFIFDGYKYYQGNVKTTNTYYTESEVCRSKI